MTLGTATLFVSRIVVATMLVAQDTALWPS